MPLSPSMMVSASLSLATLLLCSAALADGPAKAPKKKPALSCELVTTEAPAGGRLEVTGTLLGKSPLVKIAGKVARLIDRSGDTVAVQIPKKSPGGAVTVHAGGKQAHCGDLKILGEN